MKYIHQQPGWPNFKYDLDVLSPALDQTRQRQQRFLNKMQTLGFGQRAEANVETLTSELVKSSAIEGEILDRASVRSSLARRLGVEIGDCKPIDRHVDGLVEMVLDATRNYSAPLTKERLCGWHATLFPSGYSGMHRIDAGQWRSPESGPMQIVSGAIGREKVHYEAPPAEAVDREMDVFLQWANAALPVAPLLKAGIAHYWFVAVHPFEDGNGRIGRAIADFFLARSDDSPERFYSLSAQIEKERNAYYEILERTSGGGLDITPMAAWFVGCVDRSIAASERSLEGVFRKRDFWREAGKYTLNERQKLVIARLFDGFQGNLTAGKYAKLTQCTDGQALEDLRQLTDFGLMVQKQTVGGKSYFVLS